MSKARAPKKGDTFYCECRHCGGRRSITTGKRARYADDPTAPVDLFAENDCKCPTPALGMAALLVPVACDECGETGKHWLGCAFIGLPEMPKDHGHGGPTTIQ